MIIGSSEAPLQLTPSTKIVNDVIINRVTGVVFWQDDGLEDTGQMLRNDHELSHRRLRGVLEEMEQGCEEYLRQASLMGVGAGAGRTNLDKHRLKFCRNHMVSCT